MIGSAVNRLPRNSTAKRGIYALGIEDRLDALRARLLSRAGGTHQRSVSGRLRRRTRSRRSSRGARSCRESENLDELGRFQHIEIRSSLPDELLMFADKLSMAHGLEVRVPYLDRTVVEFAERLNAGMKIRAATRQVVAPPGVRAVSARAASQSQETRLRGQRRRSMVPVVGEQHLDGHAARSELADVRAARSQAGAASCSRSTDRARTTITSCCSAWRCSNSGCEASAALLRQDPWPPPV